MTRRLLRLAAVASLIVALDQWTKALATRALAGRPPVEIVGELVRLTYTRNSGVAFGLGAGLPFPYYVFSIAAVLVILWLFARQRVTGGARQFALALILGGAIGNLIDRVLAGEVVDFIEIGWGRWHWPVFNVADSAVSIGVVLFAFTWPRRHETHVSDPAAPPAVLQGPGDDPSARLGGPDPQSGRAAGSLPGRGADRPLA